MSLLDTPVAAEPKVPAVKKREVQKYIDVKEKHDDNKLASAVISVSELIRTGKKIEAQKYLDGLLVETKGSGTGRLPDYITWLDFQNRAKDGRIIDMPVGAVGLDIEDDMKTLVKSKSNLAKLIQLYVIAFDGSVQKTDMKNSLAWVDGDLERFSMQGVSQIKKEIGVRRASEKLRSDISDMLVWKWVKWVAVDLLKDIERSRNSNPELQTKRNFDVQVIGNIVKISSYGESSTLNLMDGTMSLGSMLWQWTRAYPFSVHLVRDSDDMNKPIMIDSDANKKSIRGAIQLMNFIHFTMSEFMGDKNLATIQNHETPFYLAGYGNLYIDNSVYGQPGDTTVAKFRSLNNIFNSIHKSDEKTDFRAIARFLNEIFRKKHLEAIINSGSTYVGWGKPIRQTP